MAIRVLHVVQVMSRGGVETGLLNLLRHTDRAQCAMDICSLNGESGPRAEEVASLGGRAFGCALGRNPWSFGRRFAALLKEGRYDVVHSHVQHFSGYILRIAARQGVPIRIAHSRIALGREGDSLPRCLYHGLMRRWIERYATAGLAVSEAAAAELFGPHWQANPHYRVMHSGLDLAPFEREVAGESLRASLGIPASAKVVGLVGRLVPQKNPFFFLKVGQELLAREPSAWLLLVGDGPLRAELERRAQELGIAPRTTFSGERADVPDLLLGAMDLFCLPSLFEGLPRAAVEAQAAGLCCLLSDVITPEADAVPGAVEFLPLSAGPAPWAEAIRRLLREPRVPRERAFAALRAQGFDVESTIAETCRIYTGEWEAATQ